MSMNGGYKIIDFQNINLETDTPTIVEGAYERLESAGEKAILVSGLTVDGAKQFSAFCNVTVSGTNFIIEKGTLEIEVAADDTVTVSERS